MGFCKHSNDLNWVVTDISKKNVLQSSWLVMGLYKKGFKITLKCNSCITGKANSYFNPLGFEVPENLPTKKYEAMLIMKV